MYGFELTLAKSGLSLDPDRAVNFEMSFQEMRRSTTSTTRQSACVRDDKGGRVTMHRRVQAGLTAVEEALRSRSKETTPRVLVAVATPGAAKRVAALVEPFYGLVPWQNVVSEAIIRSMAAGSNGSEASPPPVVPPDASSKTVVASGGTIGGSANGGVADMAGASGVFERSGLSGGTDNAAVGGVVQVSASASIVVASCPKLPPDLCGAFGGVLLVGLNNREIDRVKAIAARGREHLFVMQM